MIYHDRIDKIEKGVTDRNGDKVWTTLHTNVPAEVQPLSADEKNDVTATLYRVTTGLDLTALGTSTSLRFTYMGKSLQLQGGFERHVINGRFHHTELIVASFTT